MTADFECPYCAHPMKDAWEYLDGNEGCFVECDECGKLFLLFGEVTVNYYTQIPIDKKSEK